MVQSNSKSDDTIEVMLENMAPENVSEDTERCPISECHFRGNPYSVASHIQASSKAGHMWMNTDFDDKWDYISQTI